MRAQHIRLFAYVAVYGIAVVASFGTAGCESSTSVPDRAPVSIFSPYPWPVAPPADLGFDTVRTDSALASVLANTHILSFLVVRHDTLALEYYRPGLSKHNDFDIRSATKSVVSLLVGIAIEDGIFDSLDTAVLDLLPEYRSSALDPRVNLLTVRHLLSMRAGFDYVDGGKNSDVVGASPDWIAAFLGLPLLSDPGSQFHYSSLQAHILSAILARASGKSTRDYAADRLFTPMQVTIRQWDVDPKKIHNGGTGLWLTARDMARIGQVVLRKGRIGGAQIVAVEWLDSLAVARNVQDGTWSPIGNVNYGYLWWLPRDRGSGVVLAAGYGGQFIFVDPSRDLIIVTTADPSIDGTAATDQENDILRIIVSHILPAVTGS